MKHELKAFFAAGTFALALAAQTGVAQAALLAGSGPFLGAINGTQSDQASGPYPTLTFTAPASATLQEIVWWGYRLNSATGGPFDDDFTVTLGAITQTGTLSRSVEATISGIDLFRYRLDVPDALLTASSISIVSNALDFEWYWQGINASPDGSPNFRPAFNLIGTVPTATPEPGTLALVALAGLGLLAVRRTR